MDNLCRQASIYMGLYSFVLQMDSSDLVLPMSYLVYYVINKSFGIYITVHHATTNITQLQFFGKRTQEHQETWQEIIWYILSLLCLAFVCSKMHTNTHAKATKVLKSCFNKTNNIGIPFYLYIDRNL